MEFEVQKNCCYGMVLMLFILVVWYAYIHVYLIVSTNVLDALNEQRLVFVIEDK